MVRITMKDGGVIDLELDAKAVGQRLPRQIVIVIGGADDAVQIKNNACVLHSDVSSPNSNAFVRAHIILNKPLPVIPYFVILHDQSYGFPR